MVLRDVLVYAGAWLFAGAGCEVHRSGLEKGALLSTVLQPLSAGDLMLSDVVPAILVQSVVSPTFLQTNVLHASWEGAVLATTFS